MKNVLFVATFFLIIFFISGCHPSRVVVFEKPMAPHYIQPAAPGPNYIWHSGEWIRYRNSYIYRKGYWIAAPSSRRYYVSGYWQPRRGGWVWRPGYWRH